MLDNSILLAIANHTAETQSALAELLNVDRRKVDAVLQRLRRKEHVFFSKDEKRWAVTADGQVEANKLAPSKPSETVGDELVDSQSKETPEVEEKMNMLDDTKDTTQENTTTNLDELDAAIASARDQKGQAHPADNKGRKRKTPEERDAERQLEATAREERKAEKERIKAEKLAAKNGAKAPHMSKVDRAASKLPRLSENAQQSFNELTLNLSSVELSSLAAWLQHHNRINATELALNAKVSEGQQVEIVGGDPRYVGMTGVVAKAQRIRCYVDVNMGSETRQIYLFTSEVTPVEVEEEQVAAAQ